MKDLLDLIKNLNLKPLFDLIDGHLFAAIVLLLLGYLIVEGLKARKPPRKEG